MHNHGYCQRIFAIKRLSMNRCLKFPLRSDFSRMYGRSLVSCGFGGEVASMAPELQVRLKTFDELDAILAVVGRAQPQQQA